MLLDKAQAQQIRDRWNEQAKGLHQGGTPILTGGLRVMPWSMPAKDAQLAELSKLSTQRIAHAFSVPLQLLGLATTPASSTEALMQLWLAQGLGFCLNHVEQSFDQLFNLEGEPDDYTELDTAALLRSAQKDRIEALVRGVQGGVISPNEARNMEGFDSVACGDEPRCQMQVVPLSAAGSIPAAPGPEAPAAPTAVKAYEADLAALRARAGRPERRAALNGDAAEPRVVRKTKASALCP
jgi:phage portal protein BeeE